MTMEFLPITYRADDGDAGVGGLGKHAGLRADGSHQSLSTTAFASFSTPPVGMTFDELRLVHR